MPLEIQERDLKIFKLAFENRAVKSPQLKSWMFNEANKSIVSRRLRMLCFAGYLTYRVTMKGVRSQIYFTATEKSLDLIRSEWDFKIDRPHFETESPLHDIRLGNLRRRLEELSCFKEIITENLFASSSELKVDERYADFANLNSDAALVCSVQEGIIQRYAIELELSKKSAERYIAKLSSYYQAYRINCVLYICPSFQIMNAVTKADVEARKDRDSIVYLAHEDEILTSTGPLSFRNSEGDIMELI